MEAVNIREATREELADILEVQKAAFGRYLQGYFDEDFDPKQMTPIWETPESLEQDFQTKAILVATVNGMVAGSVRYLITGGVCRAEKVSVDPSRQGHGIGKELMREVELRSLGRAHKITLETILSVPETIRFYTRLGYQPEAVLRKHFGRLDWVVFAKFF